MKRNLPGKKEEERIVLLEAKVGRENEIVRSYRGLGGGARHRREINRSRQGETQGTFRVEKIFSVGRKVAEEFAFQSARGPGAACIREQRRFSHVRQQINHFGLTFGLTNCSGYLTFSV